jgi:hypothetical protein
MAYMIKMQFVFFDMIYGIEIENIWDVGVVMEFIVLVTES